MLNRIWLIRGLQRFHDIISMGAYEIHAISAVFFVVESIDRLSMASQNRSLKAGYSLCMGVRSYRISEVSGQPCGNSGFPPQHCLDQENQSKSLIKLGETTTRPDGLVVRFSLWAYAKRRRRRLKLGEVPGSNPGWGLA